jgi:hypothetical protein
LLWDGIAAAFLSGVVLGKAALEDPVVDGLLFEGEWQDKTTASSTSLIHCDPEAIVTSPPCSITTQVASSRATPAMPRVTVQHHISKQFEIIIKQGWGRKMVSLAIQTA